MDFPTLAILARRYLAIPASSAPSESIFSIAGDIITKKSNRLSDESFRLILVLKNWGIPEDILGNPVNYVGEEETREVETREVETREEEEEE